VLTTQAGGITEKRLEILTDIHDILSTCGINIPKPMINKDDKFISTYKDFPVITYSFVYGESCKRKTEDVQRAFMSLGKVHRALSSFLLEKKDMFVSPIVDLFYEVQGKNVDYKGKHERNFSYVMHTTESFLEKYASALEKATSGIIHGDFALKHVLKQKENEGVIDWDYYSSGVLIHDLSRLYDDSIRRNIVDASSLDAAVTNYNELINLKQEDINLFPQMKEYRLLYRSLNIARKLMEKDNDELGIFFQKIVGYLQEVPCETHHLKL
jgi:Ser/Thr protein kinase RdoA (MazF antagonist)